MPMNDGADVCTYGDSVVMDYNFTKNGYQGGCCTKITIIAISTYSKMTLPMIPAILPIHSSF